MMNILKQVVLGNFVIYKGHVSGGLNTQAIHHCLPPISAMHLRSSGKGGRVPNHITTTTNDNNNNDYTNNRNNNNDNDDANIASSNSRHMTDANYTTSTTTTTNNNNDNDNTNTSNNNSNNHNASHNRECGPLRYLLILVEDSACQVPICAAAA